MKETHSKVMDRFIPLIARLHPHRYSVLLPIVLILFSTFLYLSSLKNMDIGELTDIGLISILPVPVFIALIVLCGSYLYSALQSEIKPFLLFLHLVVLILILFGTTIWLEESPRFNVTWRHVGIVNYIAEHVAGPFIGRPAGCLFWLAGIFHRKRISG